MQWKSYIGETGKAIRIEIPEMAGITVINVDVDGQGLLKVQLGDTAGISSIHVSDRNHYRNRRLIIH